MRIGIGLSLADARRAPLLTITPAALASPTFSRPGPATEIDATGVLQTAAANVVPDAHYEQGVRTILLEGAGDNLVPNPVPTDIAQFGFHDAGLAIDAFPAGGALLATGVHYPDNSAGRAAYFTNLCAPNTQYTLSVFIVMDDGAAPVPTNAGNDPTGDFTFIVAGGTAPWSRVEQIAGSLYRVTGQVTTGSSIAANNTGVIKRTTNSARGFRVTGYQLEPASFPSSLILDSTRAPDLIGWTIPDAPHAMEWRGSFFEHGNATAPSAQRGAVAYLGNDAGTGAYLLVDSNGGGYNFHHHNGTTLVTSPAVTAIPIGARVDWRAMLYPDGSVEMFLSVNGAQEITGGRTAANAFNPAGWGGQTFRLNSRGTSNQGNAAYLSAVVR